jgi:hypothetical protein
VYLEVILGSSAAPLMRRVPGGSSLIPLLVEGLPTLRVRTALEHAQARRRKTPASPGSCSETGGLR